MVATTPIPKRLKQARELANITQKELGILAGIDEDSASPRINQYEKGKHTPDFQTMERLARALKTPTPYFYCTDDTLAELIMLIGKMGKAKQRELLKTLR